MIDVVDYDPAWPQLFESIRCQMRAGVGRRGGCRHRTRRKHVGPRARSQTGHRCRRHRCRQTGLERNQRPGAGRLPIARRMCGSPTDGRWKHRQNSCGPTPMSSSRAAPCCGIISASGTHFATTPCCATSRPLLETVDRCAGGRHRRVRRGRALTFLCAVLEQAGLSAEDRQLIQDADRVVLTGMCRRPGLRRRTVVWGCGGMRFGTRVGGRERIQRGVCHGDVPHRSAATRWGSVPH